MIKKITIQISKMHYILAHAPAMLQPAPTNMSEPCFCASFSGSDVRVQEGDSPEGSGCHKLLGGCGNS